MPQGSGSSSGFRPPVGNTCRLANPFRVLLRTVTPCRVLLVVEESSQIPISRPLRSSSKRIHLNKIEKETEKKNYPPPATHQVGQPTLFHAAYQTPSTLGPFRRLPESTLDPIRRCPGAQLSAGSSAQAPEGGFSL